MAQTDPPGGDNVKNRALIRLGIAGGVTVLALGGLWWLDRQGAKPPPEETAEAPKPIVSASQPEPAPPPAEAPAGAEPALPPGEAQALPDEPPAAASAAPPTRPAPPPPRVVNEVVPPPARPVTPAAAPVAREPASPARTPGAAAPLPSLTPTPAPPAEPRDFVVRLGVFSNPANAQELVERLRKQGIRAYTETRVHVGPFLKREEAERARAELARLGVMGVVAPGAATK